MGRGAMGSAPPCPFFFGLLDSALPGSLGAARRKPSDSLPPASLSIGPSHPTRSPSGLPRPSPLPALPDFLSPSSCTCSSFHLLSPQSRERVATGSESLILLLPTTTCCHHTTACFSGNRGGSGCSFVQQTLVEHLLCGRPCTRLWGHQVTRADPVLALSHQLPEMQGCILMGRSGGSLC